MMRRYGWDDLRTVMQRLRDPKTGCPWDLEQRFETIAPFTIEEAYEVVDAIERGAFRELPGELGDLLFQSVFYAQMAEEQRLFSLDDVIHGLVAKLILRHPHVFPDGTLTGARAESPPDMGAIKQAWERQKAAERADRGQQDLFDDIPPALPALSRAQKVQKRARMIGFDWSSVAPVFEALRAEVEELSDALASGEESRIADELGDVLFSAISLARHHGLDAEQVCRQATLKFMSRIRAVQALAREDNIALTEASESVLDRLWMRAKAFDSSTF